MYILIGIILGVIYLAFGGAIAYCLTKDNIVFDELAIFGLAMIWPLVVAYFVLRLPIACTYVIAEKINRKRGEK